ncbi:VOC family protein [uncultured Pseudokineococcus sp.]|uniref:VOC family protein n=1 Tax=uncultured Pseudokineococcus sp. TaxID=1642928 RepID=UPI0034302EE6
MIFVNLPVDDVQRSADFFSRLGLDVDDLPGDDRSASVVVGRDAAVLLLERGRFAQLGPGPVAAAGDPREVVLCLSASSREEVDDIAARAETEGGACRTPAQDDGSVYRRTFLDPDGHAWGVLWMDPAAPAA